MCSIGEEDFGDDGGLHSMPLQKNDPLEQQTEACSKCGQTGEVFKLQFRQPECRNCFLIYARHKFRAAIGASKVLPREACVLVIFDGSVEAMVLLDMLQHAQAEITFKRLQCTSKLLFIDGFHLSVPKISLKKRKEYVASLNSFCSRYKNLESFVMPFSKTITIVPLNCANQNGYSERDTAAEDAFIENIRSISTATSRLDFLKLYRNHLITAAADYLKCQHVFVADTSGKLAAELFSAVALGRGGSVASDVALLDPRFDGRIKLIRPLRDLTDAEVELYLRARHISPIYLPKSNDDRDMATSLQGITRSFIENLQHSYASTVPTVFRTGSKIASNSTEFKTSTSNIEQKRCAFCNSSLNNGNSSTLLAIKFSSYVSQHGVKSFDEFSDDITVPDSVDEEEKYLCHSCTNIQRDNKHNIFELHKF